jgi:hypothetical protein
MMRRNGNTILFSLKAVPIYIYIPTMYQGSLSALCFIHQICIAFLSWPNKTNTPYTPYHIVKEDEFMEQP